MQVQGFYAPLQGWRVAVVTGGVGDQPPWARADREGLEYLFQRGTPEIPLHRLKYELPCPVLCTPCIGLVSLLCLLMPFFAYDVTCAGQTIHCLCDTPNGGTDLQWHLRRQALRLP